MTYSARLLICSPDQPGLVARVAGFFYQAGANILDLDQHTDEAEGTFFMRLAFQMGADPSQLLARFGIEVAKPCQMQWQFHRADQPKRMAIFVSRYDHGLLELLLRVQNGGLNAVVPMVISNHQDLRELVTGFGIPFHYVRIDPENKAAAETKILAHLGREVDLIVLARYMQILSPEFVAKYPHRMINIHHSFLPAFAGADPYQQAFDKGVKLIGATSHYVTDELDMGPIIEQNVARVSHRHSVADLKSLGQEVERQVLVRAVQYHLENRVMVSGNKTVVFTK